MYKLPLRLRQAGFLLICLISILAISGCTVLKLNSAIADAHNPETVKAFEKKINSVAKEVQNNPNYKRIPLDKKEDQEWFVTQAFLYWDNKTTKEEFINNGVQRFPKYRDSFVYLSERIKK